MSDPNNDRLYAYWCHKLAPGHPHKHDDAIQEARIAHWRYGGTTAAKHRIINHVYEDRTFGTIPKEGGGRYYRVKESDTIPGETPVAEAPDGDVVTIFDRLADPRDTANDVVMRLDLTRAMAAIPQKDRQFVYDYHVQGLSAQEMADKYGMVKNSVSRKSRQICERLRDLLD